MWNTLCAFDHPLRARGILLGALLCLIGASAHAETPIQNGVIDYYVREEMVREQIPGLALLILRHGHVEKMQGYGLTNVELRVPVTPKTVFQSGSVGKQFTAMAVLMLAERNKLALTDPITRFFPDAPDSWKSIRVENLLSHTAGFGDYPEEFDYRKDYTEEELVHFIEQSPLKFTPGTNWSYSNLGYVLLGVLIHRASGQSRGDFLHDDVFTPLGMPTARAISAAEIIPDRASGYRLEKGRLNNQKWVSPSLNMTADGGLELSLMDFIAWDKALRQRRLISSESYRRMWTPFPLSDGTPNPERYGFGWRIRLVGGHQVIEHRGARQGFTTNISRYIDDDMTIVILTNQGSAEPANITHHIAGLIVSALAEPPRN
jgi:CubicO group peptidase (beta-lactamase class C family)